MKSLYKIVAVAVLMLFTVQCEVIDSDLLNSPNAVSPENVDPDFLLNNIQLGARGIYSGAALRGSQLTRQRRLFGGTYDAAIQSQFMNGVYNTTYSTVFADIQTLTPIAEDRELYFHLGMAQVFQAYGLLTMVDLFGDMPFSEALDADNFNPNVDSGADIYAAALNILDEAIDNLQNPDRLSFPASDLYYPGFSGDEKVEAWVRTANTLKLKAYVNMRHVDPAGSAAAINELVNDPIGLIVDPSQDFTFDYSTTGTNPDSRHPLFTNNYLNGANDYLGVGFLNVLLNNKEDEDPRIRYYIYRQTTQDTENPAEQSCLAATPPSHYIEGVDPHCQLGDGYWGNGHLNTEGIPPDQFLRSTFGVYPVGGEFDANQQQAVNEDMGYQGAGFRPILMSSFTHFLLAEAALTLDGVALDARQLLLDAVDLSISTVVNYGADAAAALGAEAFEPSEARIARYLDEVNQNFDENPIRTIAVEFYIASFPNGMEAYNVMRRTGFPNRMDGIQAARNSEPGDFYRTLPYAANLINRNSNVSAKESNLVRTFWDTRGEDTEFNF